MKKILSIWLLVSFFSLSGASLTTLKNKATDTINILGKATYTCLLCGFDNASGNTDTIILANYNSVSNSLTFVHIPRDTYFNFGKAQNKINQISPVTVSEGKSTGEGLNVLTNNIAESLSVDIDGYTGFTEQAVVNLIDIVGGVNINVPCNISGNDFDGNYVEINKGEQLLSGREALVLLRHRSTYALGDLTRIDMQKLFLSSLVEGFFDQMDLSLAYKLITTKDDGVIANVNFMELLSFAVKNLGRIKDSTVKFATLPGRAIETKSGLSYYQINKPATVKLLSELGLNKFFEVDKHKRFLCGIDSDFEKIYLTDKIKYKIYASDDLSSLKFIIN